MNVSLTPDLDQFVLDKVNSGRYTSASEVVREALRLMEDRDKARNAELVALNTQLTKRLRSLDLGKSVEPADAKARFMQKSAARRQSR